ncbi:MAG: ABC transporter substrate-binding protein [Bradyrhizobium sp.]|uniref:ABC transporter substrate-binding protein n=3 Tax=Nitrobacteraceae TaxID=41294 RepID=A0ABS5G043_9BRAD|nr:MULTISPECIES: ABC transporter substrate-binding protein [Bradyrhizobium]RTL96019.1 MAG: ABC transporter substrate-binding protein [Bradyrhizobiaceae bacterium]MBR1134424.1 ABC transporter substrate-binding protein [Bradyrhizobium denitrificans]MCL8483177.1 ABC transporter substrate-binding protein [Bradyrhizobium denitrificans]MDU1491106.1 ABC transporter substrate-binding protein [Bradyrhizobium sp.]MDU1541284.1 ABC transporter substrate-binding protein [Bradyrhizobium sp.]
MAQALLSRTLMAAWLVAGAMVGAVQAQTLDKVSFGTNWVAEAEHGGFFQAVADGTYKRYGLDVTIVPGGPNENNRMLLISGKIEFFMAANTLMAFDAVANNVPVVSIAAMFQKDPQVFLTHPESKITKLDELKPLTLFVSKEGISSYYQWLKSEYGFSEKNVRPYTFNPQPFIATAQSAMQGYVTSEPFAVERAAGFKPGVILLADYGFNTYSTLIETRRDLIESKPDLVQRFVDASIIGWYNYIYGDNSAGNALIKKMNPEMTDDLLAYSVAKMKEYGIVDSGDSVEKGIGAMTEERITSFFDKMVRAGVVKPTVDYRKSYTLRFVNKGVGVDLRPKK